MVALESTVITHGLPRPDNLALAAELEDVVRAAGAEPATIGVLAGELIIGMERAEIEALDAADADKASAWNLAALLARGASAGTTVATTLLAAESVGLRVFATGGIGGVHDEPFDESADLLALSRHRVVTVCSGPKSLLNVHATMERLETLGVPVIGYRSDWVAGFHVSHTDIPAPSRADRPEDVASVFRTHTALGLRSGLLVTNPVTAGLNPGELAGLLDRAKRDAQAHGVRGKDTTPFLLARLADVSGGATVTVNRRLLRENARLAAEIAHALVDVSHASGAPI